MTATAPTLFSLRPRCEQRNLASRPGVGFGPSCTIATRKASGMTRLAVQSDLAPGFAVPSQQGQGLKDFDWARLTFELDSHLDGVHSLVRAIYWTWARP